MGRSLTAEESKKESIDSMGESLGELYHYLWQELVWIYSKWFEFVTLYGSKPCRIDLMNEAAPYFFRVVQDVLWGDIILGIARITDLPKSMGKANLTVRKIPDYITDKEFNKEVTAIIDITIAATEYCRDWRNRRLAHRDLLLSTEKRTKELEIATIEKTKIALHSIGEVLNKISYKFMETTTLFEHFGDTPGNASILLRVIYDGLKVDKERKKRIDDGVYRDEDFEHPDI